MAAGTPEQYRGDALLQQSPISFSFVLYTCATLKYLKSPNISSGLERGNAIPAMAISVSLNAKNYYKHEVIAIVGEMALHSEIDH